MSDDPSMTVHSLVGGSLQHPRCEHCEAELTTLRAQLATVTAKRDALLEEVTVLHNTCGHYERQLAWQGAAEAALRQLREGLEKLPTRGIGMYYFIQYDDLAALLATLPTQEPKT